MVFSTLSVAGPITCWKAAADMALTSQDVVGHMAEPFSFHWKTTETQY